MTQGTTSKPAPENLKIMWEQQTTAALAHAIEPFIEEHMSSKTALRCTQCGRETAHDPTDGLPHLWAALPMAHSGESVDYTGPGGDRYTSQDVGGDAEARSHAYLCPVCSEAQWPWR